MNADQSLPRGTWRPAARLACGGLLVVLAGGCVSTKSERSVTLRPDQFVDPSAPVEDRGPPPRPPVPTPAERRLATAVISPDEVLDVVAIPGEPVLADVDAAPQGASVLVDGTAGYINNKAIYINDFLAPIADRLRAEAHSIPRAQWIGEARASIANQLNLMIRDELLRAEAMAQIATDDDKRRGLLAYFDQKRDSILSRFGGTESSANQQLSDREEKSLSDFGGEIQGKSVDEVLDAIKKRELISYQLQTRVGSRAYVPWRDVTNAYENQYERFNPPPTVVLRIIQVPVAKPEVVEEAKRQIESGADFAELASLPWNDYLASKGGLFTRKLEGPFESSTLVPIPPLDEAAHKLKPGQTAGPITFGAGVYWIRLEEVRTRSMGLYEAQLSLESELRSRKFDDELARHLKRLKERASFTGVEEMTDRLLTVAIERYYPEPAKGGVERQ